jgi:hypothetical protein
VKQRLVDRCLAAVGEQRAAIADRSAAGRVAGQGVCGLSKPGTRLPGARTL